MDFGRNDFGVDAVLLEAVSGEVVNLYVYAKKRKLDYFLIVSLEYFT